MSSDGAANHAMRERFHDKETTMRTIVAFAAAGLLLIGIGRAEAAVMLPWATLSDLEPNVTQALILRGCGDARPMSAFVVMDGSDEYYLVVNAVNADIRWVLIGPLDPDGQTHIWYGTVAGEERLVINGAIVGTSHTDVCPFLMTVSA